MSKDQEVKFRYYQDRAGMWRWRLRAANSLIIAESGQGYHRKEDCIAGVTLVKLCAPGAPVEAE